MSESQTFATHRRFHPYFHFILFPLSFLYLVFTLRELYKAATFQTAFGAVGGLVLVMTVFLTRLYALKVQDRLIRLEETLRLQRVLPNDLQGRIPELRVGQFVGLRFASDAELPGLVKAALEEQLGGEAIKKRIQSWRGDHFRV